MISSINTMIRASVVPAFRIWVILTEMQVGKSCHGSPRRWGMFESGNPQRHAGDHHLLRSLHENYLSFLSGKDECGDDERWDGNGRLRVIMGGYGHVHLALVAFHAGFA